MASAQQVEELVSSHLRTQDWSAAAVAGLEGYGPGILRFLFSMTRDEDLAHESYSLFCENMWKGLPKFRAEASFHAWVYRIARHAALRVLESPARRPARNVAFSEVPHVMAAADKVRTATLPHLRTEVKERVRQLREQLSREHQALLTLRIDRQMSWNEIAEVMSDPGATDQDKKKLSATMRKRYERAKDRLRKLVEEANAG